MRTLFTFATLISATAGATQIAVRSHLFAPLRALVASVSPFFGELVNCCLCSGFWIGLVLSLAWLWPNPDAVFVFCIAASGSLASALADAALDALAALSRKGDDTDAF